MKIIESGVLAQIRSEVCNIVLVWLLVCALCAFGIVVVAQPDYLSASLLGVYAACLTGLAILVALRRKLPYLVRAGTIILLGFIAGFSRLGLFGVPFGLVPLAAVIVWAALFFGERVGIAAAATVFAGICGTYFGFEGGLIPPPHAPPSPLAPSTWLAAAAVLAATTLGPLVAIARVGQRLDSERQNAEATSQAKSEFLATMGHELKTPLNAIIGFIEALRMGYAGPPNSPRYLEYAGHIHRSAHNLLTIVNDLLELARADALQREAKVETLSVAAEVAKAAATVEPLVTAAGLHVRLDFDGNAAPMLADPMLFHQIMLNLLSNAIKFTPAGGIVTVRAQPLGDYMRIAVSDTGIGIPADQIPNLGQPFRQASHPTVRTKEGTGLGLALAKSFTELQGGRLSIQSTVGVGTAVLIDLPVARLS